ncbi:hypothetical protein V2J09_001566 [Rumex salicifolius]
MASNSLTDSRPLMLKDFLLLDESGSNSPKLLDEIHRGSGALGPGPPPAKMRRSRSRFAIAALLKLLTSVKSHSSKKTAATKTTEKKDAEIFVGVRVKDILRWRSLRDLMIEGIDEEEKAPPLDCFSASPNGRSSFDAGEKRNVGGEDPMMAETGSPLCSSNDHVGPAKIEQISTDDEEQYSSPISVLHSPFRDDDDDSVSSLDQSLANVERTKKRLMESIKWLESLAGVDSTDSDVEDEIGFVGEPKDAKTKGYRCKDDMPETRASVGSGKKTEATGKMEECVREMERETQWSRFDEQTNQLGVELGLDVLNSLIDDIVVDLVGRS